MRVAIISAGPSAKKTWNGGKYAWTIAVNMGLAVHPCDWLVAGDANCILQQLGEKRPTYGVWTMADEVKNVHALWPNTTVNRFDTLDGVVLLPRPFNWSSQGALAVALSLYATEVDLYGCDMSESKDVAGYGDYHCADRWERERRDLKDSIDLLASRGCTVRRITPFPWE